MRHEQRADVERVARDVYNACLAAVVPPHDPEAGVFYFHLVLRIEPVVAVIALRDPRRAVPSGNA